MKKKKLLAMTLCIALVFITSCGSEVTDNTATTPTETIAATETTTGITTETTTETTSDSSSPYVGDRWVWAEIKDNVSSDMEVRAQDDFHLYVNKDWILENEIPDGYSTYSKYKARQDDVDAEGLKLMTDTSLTSDIAKQVQDMYATIMDWDTRDQIGYEPLLEDMDYFNSITTLDDIYDYMTDTSEGYPDTLFGYGVETDLEDSTQYILYISQTGFILDDAAEYQNRTDNGQLIYDLYHDTFLYMMGRMDYSEDEASQIFDGAIAFEAKLAASSYTVDDEYGDDYTDRILNKMSVEEVEALCTNYPMDEVLSSIGMEDVDVIDVTKPDYFKNLDSLMTEENVEGIKDLLIVEDVLSCATYLDKETYETYRSLYNNAYGITGTKAYEKIAYKLVLSIMPIQVQQLYVEQYGSAEKKQLMTDTCKKVIATYEEMLGENDYLSEETKQYAIDKLKAIQINSLYPDKWQDTSDENFEGLSLLEAINESGRYEYEYNLSKVGTTVDKDLWIDTDTGMTILECNAFYYTSDNGMYMILGMMGDPFYNEDMSIEEIYASLGAFWIGHEISHAFDSNGSMFDKDGNYYDWWTEEDYEAFSERVAKLDAYLDTIEVCEGTFDTGYMIDTEMLADITGLQCALKMASKEENFDYDLFFRTYASMNVSIATRQVEMSQLATDAHPLDYQRTNVPVQQFQEFYDTYDVKEGDGMYLAPEDRMLVW